MITPQKMFRQAEGVTELYQELELELLRSISKHLKTAPGEEFEEWQLRMLKEVFGLEDEAIELLQKMENTSTQEISDVIQKNAEAIERETDKALQVKEKPSKTIDLVVSGLVKQCDSNLTNFIKESLISSSISNTSIAGQYRDAVKQAALLHTTGALSLDDAIERTVKTLAGKGLKSGFIDKGGRYWSIERYAEAVLRTTLQNTYNEVRTERMKELGRYTVLVSSHPKSREACAYCQGKVIDLRPIAEATDGYPSVYKFGYGEPSGHRGINCTHIWLPFNPEVHTNNMPQYDPEEAIKAEGVEQGRKYIARKIRRTKKELAALEPLGVDLSRTQKKLKMQEAQMRKYCKEHGIRRDKYLEKIIE